jgi:hypothetical protein
MMDFPESSEDDSWSNYEPGAQEKVGLALRNLVRAVASGLHFEWMLETADQKTIADRIEEECRWLVHTDFFAKIVIAELGPGGIGTDEES